MESIERLYFSPFYSLCLGVGISLITEVCSKNSMANICESFFLDETGSQLYTYPIPLLFLAWAYFGDKQKATGLKLAAFPLRAMPNTSPRGCQDLQGFVASPSRVFMGLYSLTSLHIPQGAGTAKA